MPACFMRALLRVLAASALGTAILLAQEAPPTSPVETQELLINLFDRSVYFPLESGNEWVYSDGKSSFKVQVLREIQETNGYRYYELAGYFQNDPLKTRKLRRDLFGQVWEYNPRGQDFLWYRLFSFGISGSWQFETGDELTCISGSQLTLNSAGESVKVPAGVFGRALRVDYKNRCADAGISSEYFASGVGLVRRSLITIRGPQVFELVSAKVGSQRFPAGGFAVEVSVDRPLYYNNMMPPVVKPWPTLMAQITVRNETEAPVEFLFADGQRFDFVVRNALGKEVLRWSEGRAFPQVLGHEKLANGKLVYAADLVLKAKEGNTLPEGLYSLEGILTTAGYKTGLLVTQGSVRFQIQNVY